MKKYLLLIVLLGLFPIGASASWSIKSVDVMKYSKDVVCNQPTKAFIDAQVQKIKDVGANYVAVSGFYDNPRCGSDLTLVTAWVNSARSHGLNVWFRMKDLSFEGDYSVKKATNSSRHKTAMTNWISKNKALLKSGDIFTPFAEVQNGGIKGITYCYYNFCQFSSASDFNSWLRMIQSTAVNSVPAGVKVGYYGFDGFVIAGVGNPDWQGKSQLEPATIALMGEVTIDHYPEAIGHTLAQDLPIIHKAVGVNVPIIIGEYGTINASSDTDQVNALTDFANTAFNDSLVTGFNYWTLGPSGNEALVKSDMTNRPAYQVLKSFFVK